eukprot:scaffold80600_cov46-Tisochrysis_lutea.AAC.1
MSLGVCRAVCILLYVDVLLGVEGAAAVAALVSPWGRVGCARPGRCSPVPSPGPQLAPVPSVGLIGLCCWVLQLKLQCSASDVMVVLSTGR